MKIYIDADGCPVVRQTESIARRHGVPCVIVCDSAHIITTDYSEVIVTATGADSADFRLVNLIGRGDIAVTQDYGLATMCLGRGALAINQNGLVYDAHNIDSLLFSRHINRRERSAGVRIRGPKKRTAEQNVQFESALTRLIEVQSK